jgi:hypothetical protein
LKPSLGSFCANAITTCNSGTYNLAVQIAHSTQFTMRVPSPNRFSRSRWGASRPLLRGWGFRAQETHKRMKDNAAHPCHALCRARVADELQRRRGTHIGEPLKMVLSIIDRQER